MTVGRTFASYTVDGDRITGFRTITVDSGFRARATTPSTYQYPSFSDPNGTKTLVRIVGLGFSKDAESQGMKEFFDKGNAYTLTQLQQHFSKQ